MIKPTPGRVVHYYPSKSDNIPTNGDEPLAAHIACVWSDTCVNLMVIDANGIPHQVSSALLLQDDNPAPDAGYAEWMEYQKGQAAKTDELEAEIEGRADSSESESLQDNGGVLADSTEDGTSEKPAEAQA